MEPTAEELNQIGDLKGAYDWAGVPDDLRDSLGQALGDPTKIRDIIFVTRTTWDTTVGRIKGSTPPDADGNREPRDLILQWIVPGWKYFGVCVSGEQVLSQTHPVP